MKQKGKQMIMWVLPGLVIFVLDRLFKIWFRDVNISLIPGVLALRSARNTGMAMGLFSGNAMLLFVASVLVVGLCLFLLRKYKISGLARLSLSLIAGGALGNMMDRLLLGYVIDMIDVELIHFYIFNVADIGVVCGAILCGISLMFRPGDWSNK